MNAVLDASAAIGLLLGSPDSEICRQALSGAGGQAHAPDYMAMEVVSALRRLVARGVIPTARAQGAIEDLAAMNLELWPTVPLLERTWQLRDNITPFDAAYVALAELLDAVLVTADGPLARAIPQMSTVRVRLVA